MDYQDLNLEIEELHQELDNFELVSKVEPPSKRKNKVKPKVCKFCGEDDLSKLISVFNATRNRRYVRRICRICRNKQELKASHSNPERLARTIKLINAKVRHDRKHGIKIERFIWADCKSSDKKFGREFDLTKDFIREEIAKGCQYCGETSLRMTLDRIDNAIGHLKSNVVPACVRCNYVRRDMPYKAWLKVAESMRTARESGDFGDWTCEVHRGTRKSRKVPKAA